MDEGHSNGGESRLACRCEPIGVVAGACGSTARRVARARRHRTVSLLARAAGPDAAAAPDSALDPGRDGPSLGPGGPASRFVFLPPELRRLRLLPGDSSSGGLRPFFDPTPGSAQRGSGTSGGDRAAHRRRAAHRTLRSPSFWSGACPGWVLAHGADVLPALFGGPALRRL